MDTTGSVDVTGTGPEQVTMDKLIVDVRTVIADTEELLKATADQAVAFAKRQPSQENDQPPDADRSQLQIGAQRVGIQHQEAGRPLLDDVESLTVAQGRVETRRLNG